MLEIEGQPSAALSRYLGTQKMLADSLQLTACHRVISEAEKQIGRFIEQTSSLLMPETIEVYNMREVASIIKKYPIQLATLIVDTLMLATDEDKVALRDSRHRAILGIAQRIMDQQRSGHSLETVGEIVTREMLQVIGRVDTAAATMECKIHLHARKLFLGAVAESDSQGQVRTGLKGSSW